MKRILVIGSILLLCASSPRSPRRCHRSGSAVGSEDWCEDLSGKDKGEWTADETKSYAKHCVI